VRNRNLAIEYLSSTVNKNITKTDFSKYIDISRNSLKINMGLKSVGIKIACKTKTNRNRREQSRTKEKKYKIKKLFDNVLADHKAGSRYNTESL
jgi:hypothetical protein